jgi:hypothetical protein
MPVLDLQNSSLWEEVYSTSAEATYVGAVRTKPVPEIAVPVLFNSPIVAVRVTTTTQNTYRTCGWLAKRIAAGISIGNKLENRFDYSRRLFLDTPSVIDWKSFGESYKLTFQPYRNFDQITLRLWQYIGDIPEFDSQQIEALRIDVLRLEKTLQFVADRDVLTTYDVDFE